MTIHYLCRPCWDALEPGREPHVAVASTDPELNLTPQAACCRCGTVHASGIWVAGLRGDFPCAIRAGEHP